MSYERINHPPHYGGDTPYEAIKVIEAWGLGFCLGNAVKYIRRAGSKPGTDTRDDLKKAIWYLQRELDRQQGAEDAPTPPVPTERHHDGEPSPDPLRPVRPALEQEAPVSAASATGIGGITPGAMWPRIKQWLKDDQIHELCLGCMIDQPIRPGNPPFAPEDLCERHRGLLDRHGGLPGEVLHETMRDILKNGLTQPYWGAPSKEQP